MSNKNKGSNNKTKTKTKKGYTVNNLVRDFGIAVAVKTVSSFISDNIHFVIDFISRAF